MIDMPTPYRYRRRLAITLLALLPLTAVGHDYPTGQMKILHPWVDPVPAGSDRVVLSLQIVEISADDRLIGAETPVAERIEVITGIAAQAAGSDAAENKAKPAQAAGIPLQAGTDLVLSKDGPHLLLRKVLRDLPFGFEYPMTLHFERAGAVEAGLIITPDD